MEAMIGASEFPVVADVVVCGVAGRALPGETESGDLHLIAPFRGGILIAVADGLGHGAEAASAARIAVASLRASPELPAADLVRRCHAALHKTRGVVLGIASIEAERNRLSWIGIGNIDATLVRGEGEWTAPREVLPNRGGVVGHQMPSLHVASYPIARGDMIMMVTDGIDGRVHIGASSHWHPQELADYIVARHSKETDDALALVVRYLGYPL
jgi:phosphoserine phosphatase RsbX